jgi:hypothetical protein
MSRQAASAVRKPTRNETHQDLIQLQHFLARPARASPGVSSLSAVEPCALAARDPRDGRSLPSPRLSHRRFVTIWMHHATTMPFAS